VRMKILRPTFNVHLSYFISNRFLGLLNPRIHLTQSFDINLHRYKTVGKAWRSDYHNLSSISVCPLTTTQMYQFHTAFFRSALFITHTLIRLSEVRLPAGAGNFSLHHRVQTGCGAHRTSYPLGTRGYFPGE
jgi:hypothetical protein